MEVKRIIKASIFVFLLWWPVSYAFKLIEERPLNGEYVAAVDVVLSDTGWWSGSYQEAKGKYINENFRFRRTLVRFHNEIAFRFFNKVQTIGVCIGKEQYLFGDGYINSVYGKDFIGGKKINENLKKLRVISDSLKKSNVDLIVIITPGKGSFYPEYFPSYTDDWKKDSTNYETYCNAFQNSGVHFIDFDKYFLKLKSTAKYVLYPKTGIHWSDYGMKLCMDSIIKYIDKIRNINMPEMKVKGIDQSDFVSDLDMDIELGLNLLFGIPKPKMAYPQIEFQSKGKTKPKCIVIGDSYYWAVFSSGISGEVFTDNQFWYYYTQINKYGGVPPVNVKDIDLITELKKQDVVILLCNEPNLKDLGWGFIDQVYSGMTRNIKDDSLYVQKIRKYELSIRSDQNWLEQVRSKALDQRIPLDSMIRKDAEYMVEHERKK